MSKMDIIMSKSSLKKSLVILMASILGFFLGSKNRHSNRNKVISNRVFDFYYKELFALE
jgi:hypothetical protein